MKIIKPGKPNAPLYWWEGKTFACKNCECQFQMERSDYDRDSECFNIFCPCCTKMLRIVKPGTKEPRPEAIFDELFGDNGSLFEQLFGPRK